MSIKYLCEECRKELGRPSAGFHAVNEVGRKACDRCGSNEDNLNVVQLGVYEELTGERFDIL